MNYTIHMTPEFNNKSQIGWARQNPDGTITAYLGAIPVNKQIVLVPVEPQHQVQELKIANG